MPQVLTEPEAGAQAIAQLLPSAGGKVFFLTGAGMSTEAGLPDFRSQGGLWQHQPFEHLASTEALAHDFAAFTEFYRWRLRMVLAHEPHGGHRALARLLHAHPGWSLATQNVDGYHEAAAEALGLPERPWALHGRLRALRCEGCGAPQEVAGYLEGPGGAWCQACGGKQRVGVVLFGEALPQAELEGAWAAAQGARLCVVLGSSLQVSPANQLPLVAQRAGASLAIVNQGPTTLDRQADLKVEAPLGPTLEALEALLQR